MRLDEDLQLDLSLARSLLLCTSLLITEIPSHVPRYLQTTLTPPVTIVHPTFLRDNPFAPSGTQSGTPPDDNSPHFGRKSDTHPAISVEHYKALPRTEAQSSTYSIEVEDSTMNPPNPLSSPSVQLLTKFHSKHNGTQDNEAIHPRPQKGS